MHDVARRVLLILALAFCGSAAAQASDKPPAGKLPRWAVPESYRLAFRIDPSQSAFSGETVIRVKLLHAADHLWLHAKSLTITRLSLLDEKGHAHPAKYVPTASDHGLARIDFGSVLPPQHLQLSLNYRGSFSDDFDGVSKSRHGGKSYVFTQMQPVSARQAFPCFDDPGFKTPFTVTLTIPESLVGVANTRQVEKRPARKGWKTLQFAASRPLPTYLVAFAVGPWDVSAVRDIPADVDRDQPLPLRSIAYAGEGQRMHYVMAQTPGIIRSLENYYRFAYPWDKLDLLDVDGGMENPGLVVLGNLGSADPHASAASKRGAFNLAAHELAHQWTGDTVTMSWWDDLWLSEALTTWMQQKVTAEIHPEYRADLDRVRSAQRAMANDSLVSARRIRQPVDKDQEIITAFDDITYQKGASVIGMFENYIGEDRFRRGMVAYIRNHRFGSASAGDFVETIAASAHPEHGFKQAFDSFLQQSGVPYVRATLEHDGDRTLLHLTQSRYLPVGSRGDERRVWGIPVCVRYGTRGGSRVACEMLDRRTGTMALPDASRPTWFMPNANAAGYYRYGLGGQELAALTTHADQLNDVEQLAYADAIDAGFRHGDIDAATAMNALQPIASSRTGEVATAPLGLLGWIYRHEATTTSGGRRVDTWVRVAYLQRLQRLGYHRRSGEPPEDALLRSKLITELALTYRLAEVRDELLRIGDAALERGADGRLELTRIDRDLLADALAVAAQERGGPAIEALEAELPGLTDVLLSRAVVSALAHVEAPAWSERIRNFALGGKVHDVEAFGLLRQPGQSAGERDATWRWFTANYPALLARFGNFAGRTLPMLGAGDACSRREEDRFRAFFKSRMNDADGIGLGVQQVAESIDLCAALKAKQNALTLR